MSIQRLAWWAVAGGMFAVFCVWTAVLEISGRLRAQVEESR